MKNAATSLVLLAVLALPACTVNYYGVGPGGPRRGRNYDYRDSVRTTVVTQPGTVGMPAGGGNGGYQPPVRSGGVRPTAPMPPVRTPGGSPQPGYGGVRGPGRTGGLGGAAGTVPSPIKDPLYGTGGIKGPHPTTTPAPVRDPQPPTGSGSTPPVKDPLYGTGGIKGPHSTNPGPAQSDPVGGPVRHGGTGGVRSEPGAEPPVQDPPVQDPLYGTGGIKGPHPVIKTEPAADEPPIKDPLCGTGGIKGPHPVPVRDVPTQSGDEMPGVPIRHPRGEEQPGASGPGKDYEQGNKPAFVFTKSPCLGPCPSYTATVWADGRVRYNGQTNVPRIGTFTLRMAPATVAMLLQQAQAVGFAELPDHYASGATDIPATTLTIYQANGRPKTVVVEDNAPDEVNALFGNVAGAVSGVAGGNAEGRSEEK